MYTCPKCNETSRAESWNRITMEEYDEEIAMIEEVHELATFFCPSCGEESAIEDILEVTKTESKLTEVITITLEEYNRLKEIEWMYNDLCQ